MERDSLTDTAADLLQQVAALKKALAEKENEVAVLSGDVEQMSHELEQYRTELHSLLAADVDVEIKQALHAQREQRTLQALGYTDACLSKAYGQLTLMTVQLEKKDHYIGQLRQREKMYEAALKRQQLQLEQVEKTPQRGMTGRFKRNHKDGKDTPHLKDSYEALKNSGLFDSQWYLQKYPDIAADARYSKDPCLHYLKFGGFEERDPSPSFSSRRYIAAYPDVAALKINPLLHFVLYGKDEGRLPRP